VADVSGSVIVDVAASHCAVWKQNKRKTSAGSKHRSITKVSDSARSLPARLWLQHASVPDLRAVVSILSIAVRLSKALTEGRLFAGAKFVAIHRRHGTHEQQREHARQ
jgi:hypothetical protein